MILFSLQDLAKTSKCVIHVSIFLGYKISNLEKNTLYFSLIVPDQLKNGIENF